MQKKRLLWPDIIRVTAIYLVVQAHTETSSSIPFIQQILVIINTLSSMAVPVFVMLSGSLLIGKTDKLVTFYKKRIIKVLIPLSLWTFINMAYQLTLWPFTQKTHFEIFVGYNKPLLFQWLHFYKITFLSTLWFLPLILSLYLLIPLINIFKKKTGNIGVYVAVILWFFLFSVIPFLVNGSVHQDNIANFQSFMQFSGYLLVGYLLTKVRFSRLTGLTALILLSIGIIPNLFTLNLNSVYLNNLWSNYLSPGRVIASAAFFYLLYNLSKKYEVKIKDSSFTRALASISGASLGIYAIHFIVRDQIQSIHLGFLISPVVFIISVVVILFIKKLPILKILSP